MCVTVCENPSDVTVQPKETKPGVLTGSNIGHKISTLTEYDYILPKLCGIVLITVYI